MRKIIVFNSEKKANKFLKLMASKQQLGYKERIYKDDKIMWKVTLM